MYVGDIRSPIASCDVTAIVVHSTGVRTYGSGGKYININLLDGDDDIKLTLFGDKLAKMGEDLEVIIQYHLYKTDLII